MEELTTRISSLLIANYEPIYLQHHVPMFFRRLELTITTELASLK